MLTARKRADRRAHRRARLAAVGSSLLLLSVVTWAPPRILSRVSRYAHRAAGRLLETAARARETL